ncbi:MAG: hypothetical protein PHQ72_12200 [Hespellia sp.]|nr:hypothetical protein [Hespellia sp.]
MEKVKVLWVNTTDPRGAVGIVKATDPVTHECNYYIGVGMQGCPNQMVDIGYIVATGQKYPSLDFIGQFQNDEGPVSENPMDKLAAEVMEVLCDKYCKYPDTVKEQEELEQICDKCRVGKLIGIDAVNEYNRLKEK